MAPPRRKRMARAARLRSAKDWIPTFTGRSLVRGYARWYGVSEVSAVLELRMLGVHLPEERLEHARRGERARAARRSAPDESDGGFAFVAGYTSGGAPYGLTWEEAGLEEPDLECDGIFGRAADRPRQGTHLPFRSMAHRGDDALLDFHPASASAPDEEE